MACSRRHANASLQSQNQLPDSLLGHQSNCWSPYITTCQNMFETLADENFEDMLEKGHFGCVVGTAVSNRFRRASSTNQILDQHYCVLASLIRFSRSFHVSSKQVNYDAMTARRKACGAANARQSDTARKTHQCPTHVWRDHCHANSASGPLSLVPTSSSSISFLLCTNCAKVCCSNSLSALALTYAWNTSRPA